MDLQRCFVAWAYYTMAKRLLPDNMVHDDSDDSDDDDSDDGGESV